MHILMLTMSLGIGGAETHILELTRALIARGHSVTVASGGGLFVEPLIASGARHIDVPLYTKKPGSLARAYRTVAEELRKNSYDIIHAHARIPAFLGQKLARRFDIPFVTTFHGTFNPVWYWRALTRTGERTLAVSDDIRDYLMRYYGTDPEKIRITVNGIDTDAFGDAADPLPDLPAGERILTVTRLDKECAWHAFRLIEAMPAIVSARPEARLVIVGGGDVLDEIRESADRMDESLGGGRIFVLGPRGDIPKILPAADVFVGVSRAAMEAMAARLPVVLSGAQGHLGVFVPAMTEEAVETNFCCRGRALGSAEEIAQCVITVLEKDAAARRGMGEYNRAVIAEKYSVARMCTDAEETYRRVIAEHVPKWGDVVISGYYGFHNAGDDALLSSIADGLKARGVTKIAALSRRGVSPAVGVKAVSRFHMIAVWRALRHAKLLISGGGSLFQDATSKKSLAYYASVVRAAHRLGVPVMIYANGIGPIGSESGRRLAARACTEADYISVREDTSREELCRMGIDSGKIRVSADPVYRLSGRTAYEKQAKIVVSLRELAGKAAEEGDSAALEDAVVCALTQVCRERALTAVVLPMQPKYDAAISARLVRRLTEAGVETALSSARTSEEIFDEIGSARAVLAMRLHALIFATASAVPSAAISYDPKIDALMSYLGMPENTLSRFSPDASQIADMLRRILADTDAAEKLRARAADLAVLAEEDVDAAVRLLREKRG